MLWLGGWFWEGVSLCGDVYGMGFSGLGGAVWYEGCASAATC